MIIIVNKKHRTYSLYNFDTFKIELEITFRSDWSSWSDNGNLISKNHANFINKLLKKNGGRFLQEYCDWKHDIIKENKFSCSFFSRWDSQEHAINVKFSYGQVKFDLMSIGLHPFFYHGDYSFSKNKIFLKMADVKCNDTVFNQMLFDNKLKEKAVMAELFRYYQRIAYSPEPIVDIVTEDAPETMNV